MTRLRQKALGVAVAAMVVAAAAPASAESEAVNGAAVYADHCARCHVVPDYNPYGGIGSTPSFKLLAGRDDYLERFQNFFARPPHPVVVRVPGVPKPTDDPAIVAEIEIQPEQIDDIIAFIEALRADGTN